MPNHSLNHQFKKFAYGCLYSSMSHFWLFRILRFYTFIFRDME